MTVNIEKLDPVTVDLKEINLIEASAGTGKTYTISHLFLRFILEEKLDVKDILVVTYTEAATKELRGRLRELLNEACKLLEIDNGRLKHSTQDDSHLKQILGRYLSNERNNKEVAIKRLRLAVISFDESAVFTIHGFCQRMLNENAFESNIPFDLELVIDDSDILEQVVHDFWRKLVLSDSPLTQGFLSNGTIALDGLKEIAKAITGQSDLEIHDEASIESFDVSALVEKMKLCWKNRKEIILGKLNNKKENKISRGPYKEDKLIEDEKLLDSLLDGEIPIEQIVKFARYSIDAARTATAVRDKIPILEDDFFCFCEQLVCIGASKLNVEFCKFVRDEFKKRKDNLNVQGFNDILLNLRAALKHDAGNQFHKLIRSKYKAVMIDEFQDTDPVQYDIFRTLFIDNDSHTVFLIGDPKQSIYQFRGADIFAYLKAKTKVDNCLTLDTNHRSRERMINAVNHLFIQDSESKTSAIKPFIEKQIPYHAVNAPDVIKECTDCARLQILDLEKDEAYNAEQGRLAAARTTARKIAEILNQSASVQKELGEALADAPPQPSDLAVLVRSHKEAAKIQKALRTFDIPSVLQSTGNVFEADEATHLFYLMAAAAEPGEYTLRPLLTTPMSGMSLDDLKGVTDETLQEWYLLMLELNRLWNRYGFMRMFRYFMNEKNVRSILLAEIGGDRAITNLLHLGDLVHQESVARKLGINGLLAWLNEKITHPEEKPEYEMRLERDADAVKIMTVHSSKGLEFKIVFCPFEWGRAFEPWWLSKAKSIQYYERDSKQWQIDVQKRGEKWEDHKQCLRRDALAESLRLLYVGLTRAKYLCYLVTGDLSKAQQSALNYLLQGSDYKKITDYLNHMNPSGSGSTKEVQDRISAMREPLSSLCNNSSNLISRLSVKESDLKSEGPQSYKDNDEEVTELKPAIFGATIASDWGVGSFTWLTKNVSHGHKEAEPVKEQDDTEETTEATVVVLEKPKEILLPKGARTGSAVHEVFEEVDFKDLSNLKDITELKLRKYGIAKGDESKFAKAVDYTKTMVESVLSTPVQPGWGLKLSNIPNAHRLTELEFYYPIKGVSPKGLADVFREHGKDVCGDSFANALDALDFGLENGFMSGFIDLAFKDEGSNKFYILDWKTNWLGNDINSYTKSAVDNAMLSSYYLLQYHLYIVALHQYLKKLKIPYLYDHDFGGVLYTFVRGMTPGRPGHAVFFDRPEWDLIKALCSALGLEA